MLIPLVILSVSYFWNLGQFEMQPWDEAMYAMRSISIVEHGDWLDQTGHAVGGFYTSAHPPLYIWLTAATMKIFGVSPFTLRIWAVIFGVATLFLIFFIPRDRRVGLLAAVFLGSLPIYYLFCRAGQLDSIFTFFIFLGIYFWMKWEDCSKGKWIVLTGIAFGLALMSKIIVGLFLPISLFLYLIIKAVKHKHIDQKAIFRLIIVVLIGLAIALPWHLYMYAEHGISFVNYFFDYHIFRRALAETTIHSKPLGVLYYINQILIIFSASLVFLFHGRYLKTIFNSNAIFFAAFCVPFLIFTFSTSKLITYTIPMMPALAIMIASSCMKVYEDKKVGLWLILSSIVIAGWSLSLAFRTEVKQIFTIAGLSQESYIIIGVTGISMLCAFIFRSKITGKYFVSYIVLFMIGRLILSSPMDRQESIIESVSVEFKKNNYENLYYIDPKVKIEIVNPQISYYFDGIDLGWQKKKKFTYYKRASGLYEIDYKNLSNAMIILRIKHFTDQDKEFIKYLSSECKFLMGGKEFEVYVKN